MNARTRHRVVSATMIAGSGDSGPASSPASMFVFRTCPFNGDRNRVRSSWTLASFQRALASSTRAVSIWTSSARAGQLSHWRWASAASASARRPATSVRLVVGLLSRHGLRAAEKLSIRCHVNWARSSSACFAR